MASGPISYRDFQEMGPSIHTPHTFSLVLTGRIRSTIEASLVDDFSFILMVLTL